MVVAGRLVGDWPESKKFSAIQFRCGYCSLDVASERGWSCHFTERSGRTSAVAWVALCPSCNQPTYFRRNGEAIDQFPGPRVCEPVQGLPPDVNGLYEEARTAHAAGAYTAAVLALRKLLMHVAVEQGAGNNLTFVDYVEYLASGQYLGRGAKDWVDVIRQKGNEANHEIMVMNAADSDGLLKFSEMLLKLVYEFPSKVPPAKP